MITISISKETADLLKNFRLKTQEIVSDELSDDDIIQILIKSFIEGVESK